MSTNIEQERKAFEAWIETCAGHPFAGQFANLMWKAWQARAEQASTAAPAQAAEPGTVSVQFHLYAEKLPDPKHYSSEYGGQWGSDWCVCLTDTGKCVYEKFNVGRSEKEALDEGRRAHSNWDRPGWMPKYIAWAYAADVLAALRARLSAGGA